VSHLRRFLTVALAVVLALPAAVALEATAAAAAVTTVRTTATDVSAATGWNVTGPVTAWTVGSGSGLVEHVAGTTTGGVLVVFWRSATSNGWHAVNATSEAGAPVAAGSALTSWTTGSGSTSVEHVAAIGATGDLLVFYWSSGAGHWQAANASAESGRRVVGSLTNWLSKDGSTTVEHLAGVSSDGRLTVFWWSPTTGAWRSVDASAEAGRAGLRQATLTAWLTPNGSATVEHVAAVSTTGSLLVFYWSSNPGHWQVADATAESGRTVAGGLTSWQTSDGSVNVEHVAGVSSTGATTVFWWTPANGAWRAIDATRTARGPAAAGGARFLAAPSGTKPEMVVTRSAGNGLLLHWWTSALDWQVADLAATTGSSVTGDPVTWRASSATAPERIAATGTGGHLLVFESAGQERALVEALRAPAAGTGVTPKRNLRRKVLTILWDTHKPNIPQPAKSTVENAVYGAADSARDYYLKNSDGRFTIENAGVLGWYDSDYPPSEYWPGGGVAGRDSGAEAIRKAAQQFDFAQYDTNGDGNLTTDELMILFVMPGTWGGGGLGRIVGEDYTTRDTAKGITVDGKKITWISEVSIGDPMHGIVAHELSHLLLDLGDMYFDGFANPAEAGDFSIMDNHWTGADLDAAHKLKLGWLHPRPILRSGRYSLTDTEHSNSAWALINPSRGTKEYFLIENRHPAGTYDKNLPDKGLAIWHVLEDQATWAKYPPANVAKSDWDRVGGWSRQGIRLIRQVGTAPVQANKSLWDAGDAEAANPVELRWADGTPSGFSLQDLSAAGATMQATITVPSFV